MHSTYANIFTKIGLKFRAVLADSGNIGGNSSHEFHVLANSGEDLIAFSDQSDYAANLEKAESLAPILKELPTSTQNMQEIATPAKKTIAEITEFLQIDAKKTIKTLIVKGKETPYVALLLRGDHELNELKTSKLNEIATPLTFINEKEIPDITGCSVGFCGPVGLNIPLIVDRDAMAVQDFVCGANKNDTHLMNVNWNRDVKKPALIADIRKVVEGDASPDGKGTLHFARGIEVGHIFQLGDKYSTAMKATVLNDKGKATILTMGCYGIGVSRTVAACIEQNYDEHGIIWPDSIAPFQVVIVPISLHQSYRVREAAEKLYSDLQKEGFEVLFDDRKERAGVIFADMDLIGIPHRIVISESGLDANTMEYKTRSAKESEHIPINKIIDTIKEKFKNQT
jgi:prolyl-tRNA synthetase